MSPTQANNRLAWGTQYLFLIFSGPKAHELFSKEAPDAHLYTIIWMSTENGNPA
jgi:hypothetical protein